ncbi:uncharacterized protein TrAtP1_007645 [Trichoderma atroviride]|uniref:Uncharacterized protein n=1 Tax=Hypocrea atroviridis (strain ATCC 20476 / IMI 206040) TaxID=452589 RepID=G9NHS1_HYPAI|nr:uncharacterized protein TRIATDRAFT_304083 [Trichoderma atroviride IMI 206040]EHK49804.1 hypothetical protein TRIATDRAFT_304083 [Trichoderma atroviride IMI 206040]UKZ66472.1 hypothetical protein TrAtP1_007645 [Trichoderma atroviride]
MLSLAKASAPNTAKKRQLYSKLDAGVDSKRRRCEANDKVRKSNVKAQKSNNKARRSHANTAAPAVASSSLKVTETPSAGKQPSEEELCRGRRRWRAGSEPQGWDEKEWHTGDGMTASIEDRPEKPKKHDSKSTTDASTSSHDSDEEHQPFDLAFFDESSCESERIQPSSKALAASVQKLKMIQHSGK